MVDLLSSSQCTTTGLTKAVVCAILSLGGAYKRCGSGFPITEWSLYICPTPYNKP